ncbi:hypothetical protein ASPACDRAFT_78180 [Aspergillus aculeatus ATCC 16872]|uniref:Luciferase domain-containing protein n=1 Tax=Aspergillus aculeatus (strain ATCC 16872 / CBS 172.66 / WB 5094) TaxID=690307 RepID=A0A1L9WVW2_ASPA1|nr:uncharacterized protein ASPACDRAFT_78180 [Aspergillus aculeatus ATCC 16872]OJK00274.1 hypothetical protein ASPACDRAFT_78180 [Aspergillus aculeatus ATCC 16872]
MFCAGNRNGNAACESSSTTATTLKVSNTSVNNSHQQEQRRHRLTCNGEVCHAHPSDGSLHLTLHPADVKLVLERGWGQRHPLARDSWWWWLRIVPPGFVMVYAPRDAEELECVLEIIRAAAWWVSGTELCR